MFLNIRIDWIILKTYDQQFTLTTKKSLHIIFKALRGPSAIAELLVCSSAIAALKQWHWVKHWQPLVYQNFLVDFNSALTLLVGRHEEACKNWVVRYWRGYLSLEWGANYLHMVQLMPLPPHHLLLQYNPEWFTFLVPAFPGCPGKKAVKWM